MRKRNDFSIYVMRATGLLFLAVAQVSTAAERNISGYVQINDVSSSEALPVAVRPTAAQSQRPVRWAGPAATPRYGHGSPVASHLAQYDYTGCGTYCNGQENYCPSSYRCGCPYCCDTDGDLYLGPNINLSESLKHHYHHRRPKVIRGCNHSPAYGWAPPAETPVPRYSVVYQRYWPEYWAGQPWPENANVRQYPMVYTPTDTTQLGYYYQHVPTWRPNPGMLPQPPWPEHWHYRGPVVQQTSAHAIHRHHLHR